MLAQDIVCNICSVIIFTGFDVQCVIMNKAKRIIVLGAGVVGLSSAVQLQAKFPNAAITIIAEKFGKETTSDGAAGIFRPTKDKTPGVPLTIVK